MHSKASVWSAALAPRNSVSLNCPVGGTIPGIVRLTCDGILRKRRGSCQQLCNQSVVSESRCRLTQTSHLWAPWPRKPASGKVAICVGPASCGSAAVVVKNRTDRRRTNYRSALLVDGAALHFLPSTRCQCCVLQMPPTRLYPATSRLPGTRQGWQCEEGREPVSPGPDFLQVMPGEAQSFHSSL